MPELPDPIERLSSFGEGIEGGDMPLSPAAVRRRGDQIRRRRSALVAGGAALAVAALTVPVLAISGGDPNGDRDRIAPDPGPSLSTQDLITDADTEHIPGGVDWFTTETFAGDGKVPFHPCARSRLTALGAEAVFQRNFELRNSDPDAPEVVGDHLNESIAEFESPEAARDAYDTVAEWILGCEGRIAGAETYNIMPKARSVDVPTGGDAVVYDMHWGPPPPELDDPVAEDANISETGIVLVGNRLAVLTLVVVGQDYNFLPEEGGTPMDRMIPPAADRLRPGDGRPEPDAPVPSGPADPGADAIAPDFPLAAGWPDRSGDSDYTLQAPAADNPALVPAGELQACGRSPEYGDYADRLTARLSGPEDHRSRELLLFADLPAAEAYLTSVSEIYDLCPAEGEAPTMATEVTPGALGDQSFDIRRDSDGIGAVSVQVVRVGRAVLVDTRSNESNDPGPLATEAQERMTDVVATMGTLAP